TVPFLSLLCFCLTLLIKHLFQPDTLTKRFHGNIMQLYGMRSAQMRRSAGGYTADGLRTTDCIRPLDTWAHMATVRPVCTCPRETDASCPLVPGGHPANALPMLIPQASSRHAIISIRQISAHRSQKAGYRNESRYRTGQSQV